MENGATGAAADAASEVPVKRPKDSPGTLYTVQTAKFKQVEINPTFDEVVNGVMSPKRVSITRNLPQQDNAHFASVQPGPVIPVANEPGKVRYSYVTLAEKTAALTLHDEDGTSLCTLAPITLHTNEARLLIRGLRGGRSNAQKRGVSMVITSPKANLLAAVTRHRDVDIVSIHTMNRLFTPTRQDSHLTTQYMRGIVPDDALERLRREWNEDVNETRTLTITRFFDRETEYALSSNGKLYMFHFITFTAMATSTGTLEQRLFHKVMVASTLQPRTGSHDHLPVRITACGLNQWQTNHDYSRYWVRTCTESPKRVFIAFKQSLATFDDHLNPIGECKLEEYAKTNARVTQMAGAEDNCVWVTMSDELSALLVDVKRNERLLHIEINPIGTRDRTIFIFRSGCEQLTVARYSGIDEDETDTIYRYSFHPIRSDCLKTFAMLRNKKFEDVMIKKGKQMPRWSSVDEEHFKMIIDFAFPCYAFRNGIGRPGNQAPQAQSGPATNAPTQGTTHAGASPGAP